MIDPGKYTFTTAELKEMDVQTTVNGAELYYEERFGPYSAVRTWLYEDITGMPHKRTGMVEVYVPDTEKGGGHWYEALYYNADNTVERKPGPFAHNFR